jgi:hypothetical protein
LIDDPTPDATADVSADDTEGATTSPEAMLEALSAQAADTALFPASTRVHYMFAYDLLMQQALVSRLVKKLLVAHVVSLPNYKLVWPYFYPPAGSSLPGLLRTNREEDVVWGVLYDATGKDLTELESYIRVPNRYHKRGVMTRDRGGRRIPAFTYTLSIFDPVPAKPSADFISQMVSCAAERGLPEEWLEKLRSYLPGEEGVQDSA